MTATAAANGSQQRSATAHHTRTAGDNLAYATPEKRAHRVLAEDVGVDPQGHGWVGMTKPGCHDMHGDCRK